jgi:hypothetical protein
MRAFLLRCIAFAAFAAPVALVLLIFWGEVMPVRLRPNLLHPEQVYGFLHTRLREADASGPVDVLFLGSSKAYRGFDPRIWEARGIRALNLGSTGQTPLQYALLLDRYLDRLQPKLVIVEVDPLPLTDQGLESALDFFANGPVDPSAVRMAWRIGHLKAWNGLVFAAWRQWSGRRRAEAEPARQGPDTYVGGGYVQHDPERFRSTGALPPVAFAPRTAQLEALHEALRRLDAAGIPFVLVTAPITDAFARSWAGTERMDALLAPGGMHLRMQDAAAYIDTVHFYDRGHLNQDGVERFNRALLDSLERRGVLRLAGLANGARR